MKKMEFRCWFPKTKRMTENFRLGQLIEQIENTREEEGGFYLQCLELLDKNRKEIWEGDIVEIYNPNTRTYEVGEIVMGIKNLSWSIRIDDLVVPICHYCISGMLSCGGAVYSIKKIGNKFENPELLKKEK